MRRFGCLWAVVAVVALVLGGWQAYAYFWYLSLVPKGLSAPIITYRANRAYGFGPGGNEVGLIVYRMGNSSAQTVEQGGIAYLENIGQATDRRHYFDWQPTPLVPLWSFHGEQFCDRTPGIGAFLDYDDFRCRLPRSEVKAINAILTTPGSYIAKGTASSVIIVAPRERKVVIAYNG